jgi:hypothetical protein
MPTPTFSQDFAKVGIGILVLDFRENIFYELRQVSKQISLQFKTSLNFLRPSISELREQAE